MEEMKELEEKQRKKEQKLKDQIQAQPKVYDSPAKPVTESSEHYTPPPRKVKPKTPIKENVNKKQEEYLAKLQEKNQEKKRKIEEEQN